jgi:hypothetical protein
MKNADKLHLSRIAERGCSLCLRMGLGQTPAEIHHLREGQGMSQRASNWLAIGLCPYHHRGSKGIHGDRQAFQEARVDPLDLLADTIEALYG